MSEERVREFVALVRGSAVGALQARTLRLPAVLVRYPEILVSVIRSHTAAAWGQIQGYQLLG